MSCTRTDVCSSRHVDAFGSTIVNGEVREDTFRS